MTDIEQIRFSQAVKSLDKSSLVVGWSEYNYSSLDHSQDLEFTEKELEDEIARLKIEYDNDYARKRQAEYPTIAELTVALYDTDDKADIEAKRAEVKKKYPKPE